MNPTRPGRRTAVGALTVLLTMSLMPTMAGASVTGQTAPAVKPSPHDQVKPVRGANAPLTLVKQVLAPPAFRNAWNWPRPGTSATSVPTTGAGPGRSAQPPQAKVGDLPVWIGQTSAAAAPSKVQVRLDRATGAGADGLILAIRRLDGEAQRGSVRLTVDYSGFRDAYGGDWAARLRVMPLDLSPVSDLRNDPGTGRVSAEVAVGATDSMFIVTAPPEGSTGDYKATSLSPSGKWQVATHTGGFAWSYGLAAPPVPGGLGPDLAVAYSSNSADGRTASTNSQPSWVGEGWSLSAGFIERSFKSCAEDLGGNNGQTKTGDLCWETENATLSLGDRSGQLVLMNGTWQQYGTWRMKDDDGTRVEHLIDGANGDDHGESWKITTTDGTKYFFGRRADSAWTVPVFGNDTGEPCNRATFDTSQCNKVYRWNLDQVIDRHGNTMSYFYREESNLYGVNRAARAASYTRGGTLERIEFGTRTGQGGPAPARVWFDIGDRCLGTACGNHDGANWPDVPWDLECASGGCAGKTSPTFWSTKRLTNIRTQISLGGGAYRDIDHWTFAHSFPSPGDGTTPALWLTGITHTAPHQTAPITLPAVSFEGTLLANRVDAAPDGLPALYKNRITTINTESGGHISIEYDQTDCAPGSLPAADTNTKRCFPVRWVPPMESNPRDDWFHRYVVATVTETDTVGGNVPQVTNYDYVGGGAWAYDDNPMIDPAKRTWSEWRGYEKVLVRKGSPGVDEHKPESLSRHQYFRGMHGDRLAGGGTKTVHIVDSKGTAMADAEPLAGFERETIVKDGLLHGAEGPEVSGEIRTPWTRLTATQGTLRAHQVENAKTESRIRLVNGGDRSTRAELTYDVYGNPLQVKDSGDITSSTDDRCTTTTYAWNSATMLVNLPSTVTTVGVACGSTPSLPADAIADTRSYYDSGSLGAAPSTGNLTKTEIAKDYSGSTAVYLNNNRATYDSYGRPLESFDALGRKTTMSYAQTNGLTTGRTVTNALGHTTTTTIDPARGQAVRVVDANNRITTLEYDALGRLAAVWNPGRSKDAQLSPHMIYSYDVRKNGPSWVKTEKLNANQNHIASYTLLDGFLRVRQTQAPSPQGGRILTDILYDTRGLVNVVRAPYYDNVSSPGTTLFLPEAGAVPNATVKVYDGAGRETDSIYMKLNLEQWRTRTFHGGDHTSVIPPAGGTATTTFTDARGQTSRMLQYKVRPVSANPPSGAADQTTYGYTKRGQVASVTDPAGNIWRNTYDVLGRRNRAEDPDQGVTVMTYDDAGQMLTATDARGKTVTAVYDPLGRKTETWLGPTILTRSVYDTLSKGTLTSATRYVSGHAYTTSITGYDTAGRPAGESTIIPAIETGLAGTYTTKSTYAADGSPATIDLPRLTTTFAGEKLTYGYNDLGLPDTVTGSTTYVTNTEYTALGEATQVEMGAFGVRLWRTTYREEGTRRISQVLTEREQANGVMVNDLRYAYDPIGNITKITDRTAGSTADTQCFGYDYLRRVSDAWTATDDCAAAPSAAVIDGPAPYWHQYSHDLIGNRKSLTRKGISGAADTVSSYTYPASGDSAVRPHAVNTVQTGTKTDTYGYDLAGNTTTRPGPAGTQNLTWDDEGLLQSITSNQGLTSYLHDANGKQLIRRDPGSVTLFVAGAEVKRETGSGTKTPTRYYEGLGTRTSTGLTWTVADHHGTSQVAIDSATLAPTSRRLDLFGNPRAVSRAAATATWPGGNRGFVGGTTNDASGLTRLGAREYDPATGRFISVDPILDAADPRQLNAYAYSNNNPATFSDPSGFKFMEEDNSWGVNPNRPKIPKPAHPDWGCFLKCPVKVSTGPVTQRPFNLGCDTARRCANPSAHDSVPAPGKSVQCDIPGKRCANPARVDGPSGMQIRAGLVKKQLTKIAPELAEIEIFGWATFRSGSFCYEMSEKFIASAGVSGCVNWDSRGMSLSASSKIGLEAGGGASATFFLRVNSEGAADVNSGFSVSAEAGPKLIIGYGGGVKTSSEYSLSSGTWSGSVQVEGGAGAEASLGGVNFNSGVNLGYLFEWCPAFGIC